MAFPEYRATIPAMWRELVARFAARPLCVQGERRTSYAETDAASARLARGLLAQGVAKGARVGVLFPNGTEWLAAWLAASRIGAVVVPLNTFYKPRELGYVLRHADVHLLLTARRLLGNDYLERLEAFAPSLKQQRGGSGTQQHRLTVDAPHHRVGAIEAEDRVGSARVGHTCHRGRRSAHPQCDPRFTGQPAPSEHIDQRRHFLGHPRCGRNAVRSRP